MLNIKGKKINISNIAVVIFCIILIYCFLLVGSPLNNNVQIINVLFNIVAILLIIKNFKSEKIQITKIELTILILILSGFIPIIFRTQSSLSATIDSILKYIAVWNIYIIIKYILKIDKKYMNYIINAIIIASIFLVIFGIDMMNNNIFQGIYDFFNTVVIPNPSSTRMDSLFEYPNTFAMFLGISFILSIGNVIRYCKLLKQGTDKKVSTVIKVIVYILACVFQVYGIIMSGSRYSILMLIITTILWCILEGKKILNKKIIAVAGVIIVLFIIAITLCFTIDTTLVLFDETNEKESQYTKQINNVKPNTEYDFNFDIISKNDTNESEKFRIFVREYTNTAKKVNQNEISFDTFEGTKNIHIVTADETEIIRICFVSVNTVKEQTRLEIKNLTMNGEKIRLNYLFLPISLVNRIENIDLEEASITERFVIIKDGIKLAMQNFFTGFGNDGWRYNYEKVREYNYGANQMHSYIVDLFIQNGIVGLIVILLLFMFLGLKIIKIFKKKQSEYYPIILAIIFGFMHAILDFDMNFYSVLMLMFMLIAMTDSINNEEKTIILKKYKIVRILELICLIMILIMNARAFIAYKIDLDGEKTELNYRNWEEKLDIASLKVKLVPYSSEYLSEKIQLQTLVKNSSYINLDDEAYPTFTGELIDMLEYVIKYEHDTDILDSYRRLIENYVDYMNENNIDEMLANIKEIIGQIENEYKSQNEQAYHNILYTVYGELVDKLEEKNKVLQSEKLQEVISEAQEVKKSQEKYLIID